MEGGGGGDFSAYQDFDEAIVRNKEAVKCTQTISCRVRLPSP